MNLVSIKKDETEMLWPQPHLTGPYRVQKSDAGVGIGTLVGDRDYLALK